MCMSVFPPSQSCWVLCTASAVIANGSCTHSYLICGHIPFPPQCLNPGVSTYPMQMEINSEFSCKYCRTSTNWHCEPEIAQMHTG